MVDILAGKPAPREMLINVPRLISSYYTYHPDVESPEERVAFGTSGHRGTPTENSFNEDHILAVCQAICEYRQGNGITGPLYLGMDTHALSEPALATSIEVFAANGINLIVQSGLGYTPTPVVSHAILTFNRGRASGLADGVIITPSHNPPGDGGFKYNPPSAGPADTTITRQVQERANEIIRGGLKAVRRMPLERALQLETTRAFDYLTPYVTDLINVVNQPAMAHLGYRPGSLPETERAAAENLALPMWGGISADQQELVVATVRDAVGVAV